MDSRLRGNDDWENLLLSHSQVELGSPAGVLLTEGGCCRILHPLPETTHNSPAGKMQDLSQYTETVARNARTASRQLAILTGNQKIAWLQRTAELIRTQTTELISGNEQDIAKAPEYGLTEAMIDRLRLTPDRLEGIAQAVEQIALLPDPVGQIRGCQVRPNGLIIKKTSVPLGVVFFIYESRPNVTIDAAALCVKKRERGHSSRG